MQYYSDYSKQYVKAICNALNEAGFKTPIYKQDFTPENISSITDLLEGSVVYSAAMYDYLSQRGLVNTGRCPFTGESIDFAGPNYSFFDRKVYVSKRGFDIMQRESAIEYEKVMGQPKPTKPVSGGGCYIATVCYGDPFAPEVESLRIFRDRFLMRRSAGKLFVKFYYFTSPLVAAFLSTRPRLNKFVRDYILRRIINLIKKQ